ncbi:MAG: lipid A biosynthesis acyltransferase [Planctomycetota bacterium]
MNDSADAKEQPKTDDGWGVQGVGRSWQFRFFHFLIMIGGLRPAYHIAYVVVLWYVLFVPEVRERCGHYLRRRFPDRDGVWRRFWDSYWLVVSFARSMIDRAAYALVGRRVLRAECPDADAVLSTLEDGDGAVLLNAHIGCWQAAMNALDHTDRAVSLVMIPPEDGSPEAELMGEDLPFDVIDPRGGTEGVMEMVSALQQGRILGLMGDRVFGVREDTVDVQFLGGTIKVPFAPYRLASVSGKPIMVLFSHKAEINRYVLRLATVIRVKAGVREPSDAEPYAQQFADVMEEYVEEHPWQFFNFYDMWGNPFCHAEDDE